MVVAPAVPKNVSGVPSALYRATTKSNPETSPTVPPTTIFPSGWTATASQRSSSAAVPNGTRPPVPNAGSGVPSAVYRRRSASGPAALVAPATTSFPSGWAATA